MERYIGAQLYTAWEYLKDGKQTIESFKKLAKTGYKVVQVSAMGHLTAEEIKAACDESGIRATSAHCSFDWIEEDVDRAIEYFKTFGCDTFGIGAIPLPVRESEKAIAEYFERVNKVADEMAKKGAIFTYHNHAYEFSPVDGKNIMDHILNYKNENVKLMADVYWLAAAGINPVKFIRAHKDMIGGIHYKDLKVVDNAPAICEVGYGNLDWDEIVGMCDELGFEKIYVEQDTNLSPDPFTSLEMSYNFLSSKYGYK